MRSVHSSVQELSKAITLKKSNTLLVNAITKPFKLASKTLCATSHTSQEVWAYMFSLEQKEQGTAALREPSMRDLSFLPSL